MTTTKLELPELIANQAQPHVPVNTALRRVDWIAQLSVTDRAINTPPGSPVEGDCYIMGAAATGAWTGYAQYTLAVYDSGVWKNVIPKNGWLAWVADERKLYVYEAAGWSILASL
jgi:hypothetical protein